MEVVRCVKFDLVKVYVEYFEKVLGFLVIFVSDFGGDDEDDVNIGMDVFGWVVLEWC